MAERLFVDVTPQGMLLAPTAQARAALSRRAGRWVLMPSATNLLLLSQWEGPESPSVDAAERAVVMGEVAGISLMDLLALFSQTRRSLRMVVSRGNGERAILLKDGDVASVASSDPRDRLGEFLVRIGKLTPAQLQDALAATQHTGRKLGQHLVSGGLLTSHELWHAIQQQITEIICDVVAWKYGTYAVFSLPEGFAFPQTPSLGTQGLILEAARRADEMSMFRQRIPSYDALVFPTGKMPKECSAEELAALHCITAGMAVNELGIQLQRSEFETTKLLYNLLTAGAVTVSAVRVSGAAESAATGAAAAPGGQARLAQVLGVFSMALREIDAECRRRTQGEPYRQGMASFLTDPQNPYRGLFEGAALVQDGDVEAALVLRNAATHGGQDPLRMLYDGMNELTFFALFQAAELLDPQVDEDLARRVRMILSTLQR